MSVVGSFPGIMDQLRRRTVRAPVNPYDKTTIVSIYPKKVDEVKHTIMPGRFIIEPGSFEKPTSLVVGPSSWWREIDQDQPLLEIPVSSILIAESVVKDYCNGILGCNMGDQMPGLFYIPGEFDIPTIQKQFTQELTAANNRQRKYFQELLRLADSLWARSQGNPLAISDDMRLAAQQLGITGKDWMKDFVMVSMTRCKFCGALKNPEFPVCASCRAVDSSHPAAKDIKFAQ